MFCPKCKGEFREGFTRCKKCNVDLIDVLPIEEGNETSTSKENLKHLSFLTWKIEKWLKVGGVTLIVISFIVEILQAIFKFIPNIDVVQPLSSIFGNGQLLFYSIMELLYSLVKNVMYGIFYIALGKLLEVMKGNQNESN